ncbi:hypothetical protein DAPPUDRAFT_276231 [Daphnia pulex]|uniref:Uncharacterized protein n=1 Tax=Daphnia pulex TaxID=6669 RepID=E9I5R3_DAPPU|nr:hypothetical protein DAPPUDRAFT_276231 [Daphnia pulex]|eukprot:EFX60667.1 hypothetical protein DAPPUDRAFT_276231 [Daphnia pulex]
MGKPAPPPPAPPKVEEKKEPTPAEPKGEKMEEETPKAEKMEVEQMQLLNSKAFYLKNYSSKPRSKTEEKQSIK